MTAVLQRICELKLERIKLKKQQEQAVIALLEKKEIFAFCQLVLARSHLILGKSEVDYCCSRDFYSPALKYSQGASQKQ